MRAITQSLFFRLMGAFAVVILIGLSIVYVIANRATTSEFQFFMFRGQMVAVQDVANQLAEYYGARGSWTGVSSILSSGTYGPAGMGGMMGGAAMMNAPRLWLADARGIVIAGTDSSREGQTVPASELAGGTPIQVNGTRVGTLVADAATTGIVSDATSQEFLSQVNRSLLLAGLLALVIALALGFILFRQMTAPLDALEQATRQIAAGDLKARATVRGEDEISRLGRSFNVMVDRLEHSETARRNLLADIAHELRNPLGVIQSHLEAMLDGVFPTTAEQIASLHDETMLLTRIVDDLRDLALADAGQLGLHRAPTNLAALVERTTEAFQARASEHGSALECEIAGDRSLVNLDAERIEQVLRNLISNALQYSPAGSRVTVRYTVDGGSARVNVSDTGPGIPAEDLAHVFERFWRADKSRSRLLGGSGLGLAIAHQWVEAHGGKIGVTSQIVDAPGRPHGTTFWFTLPL